MTTKLYLTKRAHTYYDKNRVAEAGTVAGYEVPGAKTVDNIVDKCRRKEDRGRSETVDTFSGIA